MNSTEKQTFEEPPEFFHNGLRSAIEQDPGIINHLQFIGHIHEETWAIDTDTDTFLYESQYEYDHDVEAITKRKNQQTI